MELDPALGELEEDERMQDIDSEEVDSDLEELQGDIAKHDESVRQFLASHHGTGDATSMRGRPRGRGSRGPRQAAKPRGDITARLSKVNQAFLTGDYETAQVLAFEIIRINAETHQAWTTLSSIFDEQGNRSKALSAMVYAAYLRPKDINGWMRVAAYALDLADEDDEEREARWETARLCYSAVLRVDTEHLEARAGKADISHRQGHLGMAVQEYKAIARRTPRDIDLVRKLAEVCMDTRQADAYVPTALEAYTRYFELEMADAEKERSPDSWYDVGIYVELFASTGRYQEAVDELKRLARWLVGRAEEVYWDDWQEDDREWDAESSRRAEAGHPAGENEMLYGVALPLDLRVRLAIYRARMHHMDEALGHLDFLEPGAEHTLNFVEEYPYLVFDLARELVLHNVPGLARSYFEMLRALPGEPDSLVLLNLGRCHLALEDLASAEDCFLAAIDADTLSIEPRIELANMYEKAKEGEDAFIMAAEAMAIQEAQDRQGDDASVPRTTTSRRKPTGPKKFKDPFAGYSRPVVPRRHRTKRLVDPVKQRQEQQTQALHTGRQYETVTDLKRRIQAGETELVPEWMESSRELIDEFRSLKQFYTWEKYLTFLRPMPGVQNPEDNGPGQELARLYTRLAKNIHGNDEQTGARPDPTAVFDSHQGIPFDKWLDLFLDYAIALAMEGRTEEAYRVCESARDSKVFEKGEYNFTIHVAWSVCAVLNNDEGKSVTIARHLMRGDSTTSDASRMYALLACLCQCPISWYTSGPAQKYIMRQIKMMDRKFGVDGDDGKDGTGEKEVGNGKGLDVNLLMLYGHILFTSASYTYSLGYYLRARSLDPENAMVNFSLGLAYVHYSLKRQASNRQYLLMQGQAFLAKYCEIEGRRADAKDGGRGEGGERGEERGGEGGGGERGQATAVSYYNIGRVFQMLGIPYLAMEYYTRALKVVEEEEGDMKGDVAVLALANYVNICMSVKNEVMALAVMKSGIIL